MSKLILRAGALSALLMLSLSATSGVAQTQAEPTLTSNETAANGPLPGDVGLYLSEYACAQNLPTSGHASSINAAELTDGQRSGLFTCATFTGSFDGPNQVYAWRSQDVYQATTYINNGRPGELYITGGDVPPAKGPIPPGPYVAKADATSGREIWRTYLENGNTSDVWVASTNLNILANGNIVTSWSNRIALLDADTGLILATNTLPTGPVAVRDTTFKHVTVAPDGTLIVKNQSRPEGCTLQGTLAIISCTQQGMKQGPSTLVAVDPDTLEVLASVTLPEPSTVPHIISVLGDKIAIYLGVDSGALRYFWDPETKTLTQDESWVIKPMKEGQTTSDAPSLIGDWIVLQTNGIGSKTVASSIVAVNVNDATKMQVIFPFGDLTAGQMSFAPPKPQTDPENSMIYSADFGVGKVAGISIDQATGALETAWVIDNATTAFQPLIGPQDQRVIILSNVKPADATKPMVESVMTGAYTEQVTWRNAATGDVIAASDFFEPLTFGSLITPGFGGRLYFPTATGFITLQVTPARAEAAAQ